MGKKISLITNRGEKKGGEQAIRNKKQDEMMPAIQHYLCMEKNVASDHPHPACLSALNLFAH